MRITPTEFFAPRWSCFWATTYQFEPLFFEQFLFRRLGDPPLNVTLLIDADKLAETWEAMAGGEQWRLQHVGHDYIVRGVKLGSGSFHAKTYFFGNARNGRLLVGSGNLTLQGLEQGYEVFSHFASTDDQGLAAIRSWRDWMQELIKELGDDDIRQRWRDLHSKAAQWLAGPSSRSIFVSNSHASLLSQLQAELPSSVDEVHALAPFMDQQAAALEELVKVTNPRQLHLYVCHKLSVDGSALERVLRRLNCDVKLWRFEPDHFVHAKLIGVVWGDHGCLLSGSANLSRAAMTVSRTTAPWANVETDVIVSASASTVRSAFCPPDLSLYPLSLDGIKTLSYLQPVVANPRRYFIRFAQRLADGRIAVVVQPNPSSEDRVLLTDGVARGSLASEQTAEPLRVSSGAVLLWLEDEAHTRLSNVVALDDPKALKAWLQERNQTVDKPRELDAADLKTPIGAMLQCLHQTCIFDIDETAAASNALQALDSSGEETDPAFWERLVQEELALDQRITTYQRFALGLHIHEDEILLLLREMLNRTPTHRQPAEASEEPQEGTQEKNSDNPWTPTRRLRVRLYHVLERWSQATNDPRLRWVNPSAPVRNYAALLRAVAECWGNAYLPEPSLLIVLQTLFESFITGEDATGYLLSIDQLDREEALARIPDEARSLASALVYVALRPKSNWQNRIFGWQTFLVSGIELGIFQAAHGCDAAIEKLAGIQISTIAVEDRLLELAVYVDDAHWCAKVQKELELDSVAFDKEAAFAPQFKIALAVRGISDPLLDSRLVALVRRTFQYKKVTGFVVLGPEWRLSVVGGELAHMRLPTGSSLESTGKITMSYLTSLDQQRLGFGDIFTSSQEAVS